MSSKQLKQRKQNMLQRILDQAGDLIVLAIVSLAFGITKVIVSSETDNCFKCSIGSILISVIVGTLAGAMALQYALGDYTALTISSIASLLSRDIVKAILINRKYLGELVRQGLTNLVDKVTK